MSEPRNEREAFEEMFDDMQRDIDAELEHEEERGRSEMLGWGALIAFLVSVAAVVLWLNGGFR